MNIGIRSLRQRTILSIFLLAALILQSQVCPAQYSFTVVPVEDKIEYRFFYNQFHFGTIIENSQEAFIFRPHPDQFDVNGWGTSSYLNPFLAGGDPSQGTSISPLATAQGIQISLAGLVNQAGQANYGNFTYNLLFSYDQTYQKVYANGNLTIQLAGTLALVDADLNLSRVSSNMLTDVPLQTGSTGVTGDMSQALIQYAPAGDPRDFAWYPPDRPAHYPQDFSSNLSINTVGAVNVVDTTALGKGFQIAIARKPGVLMAFQQQATDHGKSP